jgi:hypothetical protein
MEYTKKYVQKLEKQLKECRGLDDTTEKGYVILKRVGNTQYGWVEYTAMIGTSPQDAIAKVFEGIQEPSGTYLAIPTEMWVRNRVDFDTPPDLVA